MMLLRSIRFITPLLAGFALILALVCPAQTGTPAPASTAPLSPAQDLSLNPEATINPLNSTLPTLFIAGDSTAAKNNGNPVQGWGVPFADYFDASRVNVANRARGGRSSRTFITEGLWDKLLTEVKAGDFVLIQFGHNDGGAINEEPSGSNRPLRARGSLPGLGEETAEINNVVTKKPETVHTFGWYIRKMIADVKAKGATPLVLSLTVRDIWKDGKIERGSGQFRAWDQALAKAAGIEFIDLSRIAADKYQALGAEKTKERFSPDHTHPNVHGAEDHAAGVVAGLKGVRKGPFASFLSAKGAAVEKDTIGWLNLAEPANPALPSIILIGDSTVRNGRGDGESGQWGWGDSIGAYFDPTKVNVVNRAIGGFSSRTFLTQGNWTRALGLIKRGDFVIMQFGTNDSSALNDDSRARGTIKGTGEETQAIDNLLTKQPEVVHSYGWYLRTFVRETKAAGATPVICSMIPHKTWENGKIVRVNESYAGWARQIAVEENVGFVELNNLICDYYDRVGEAAVEPLYADKNTHTSKAGADKNAEFVTAGLRALRGAQLDLFLSNAGRAIPAAKP